EGPAEVNARFLQLPLAVVRLTQQQLEVSPGLPHGPIRSFDLQGTREEGDRLLVGAVLEGLCAGNGGVLAFLRYIAGHAPVIGENRGLVRRIGVDRLNGRGNARVKDRPFVRRNLIQERVADLVVGEPPKTTLEP